MGFVTLKKKKKNELPQIFPETGDLEARYPWPWAGGSTQVGSEDGPPSVGLKSPQQWRCEKMSGLNSLGESSMTTEKLNSRNTWGNENRVIPKKVTTRPQSTLQAISLTKIRILLQAVGKSRGVFQRRVGTTLDAWFWCPEYLWSFPNKASIPTRW